MMNKELSIVVPIYNEEDNLPELVQRLLSSAEQITPNFEIILINDGSADASLRVMHQLANQHSQVFYLNFSRNFGHQIAVQAGLDASKGEAVVIIDGDLQDPPELIPELYVRYREGFDVVNAKRAKREGESWFKKATAKWFYRLMSRMTSFEIPVDVGDFRLIDRKVVNYLREMPEQNKFLRGQIAWLGFRQSEVLFDRNERKHGKTGYGFFKMLSFALDGITSFSDKPLQWVTRMGFLMSTISFVILLYALYSYFILHRTITGWTSLIISSMFIGGVQLFSVGVIGEYISRINKNTTDRPLYIIESTNLEDASSENGRS